MRMTISFKGSTVYNGKTFLGSPVIAGKEPKHEGHKVHKGEKRLVLRLFFPS